MQIVGFDKFLIYDKNGEYFDNNPPSSEFYEEEYLKINPDLHLDDSRVKIKIAIKIVKYLIENKKIKISKVIDVGSGSTLILRGVLEYLRRSTDSSPVGLAVDISKSILRRAGSYPGVYKLRSDASSLPIYDHYFDILFMFDLIEHTSEPRKVINEALRVSKYVAIKTPLELALYTSWNGGPKKLKDLETKYGHIQHFRRDDVISLLGPQTKILSEFYEKIPNRSFVVEVLQNILLKLRLFAIFRYIFGGFIILLIEAD